MTHEQIDNLGRDWPDAARKGYQYYDAVTPDRAAPDADTVYWAMVGRGLGWLAENTKEFGTYPMLGFHAKDVWFVNASALDSSGDHPLAAVSAAVLAAKEGER